jgi:hypothetical protein
MGRSSSSDADISLMRPPLFLSEWIRHYDVAKPREAFRTLHTCRAPRGGA